MTIIIIVKKFKWILPIFFGCISFLFFIFLLIAFEIFYNIFSSPKKIDCDVILFGSFFLRVQGCFLTPYLGLVDPVNETDPNFEIIAHRQNHPQCEKFIRNKENMLSRYWVLPFHSVTTSYPFHNIYVITWIDFFLVKSKQILQNCQSHVYLYTRSSSLLGTMVLHGTNRKFSKK